MRLKRRLLSLKLTAVAGIAAASLVAVAPAVAATYTYCSDCSLSAPGSSVVSGEAFYISLSYGHALFGGGVCAGAYDYASLICGQPEAEHEYHQDYFLNGMIENWNGYFEQFNAHVDY